MNVRLLLSLLIGSAVVLGLASSPVRGQGQVRQITFTGIVTGGNTSEALPGAYIYLPKAGRGVLANNVGYFALPVLPGDSVIFSYVGFQKQYHIIPRRLAEDTYSAVIALSEDVKTLAEVKVYPYATEDLFKQAFVALRLPDEKDRQNLARSTDSQYLRQMAAMAPMGATANYQNFINQQYFGRESLAGRGQTTTIPFLNPFAWASFIRSVKRGDLKTKEFREQYKQAPAENIKRSDVLENR